MVRPSATEVAGKGPEVVVQSSEASYTPYPTHTIPIPIRNLPQPQLQLTMTYAYIIISRDICQTYSSTASFSVIVDLLICSYRRAQRSQLCTPSPSSKRKKSTVHFFHPENICKYNLFPDLFRR